MAPVALTARALVLLVASSLLAACSAAVEDTGDTDEELTPATVSAIFCAPKGDGGDDLTIENAMLDMLAHTPSGAIVRVAMYQWNRVNVADAFVAASKRGVDVRIVLDNDNKTADGTSYNVAVKTLVAGLPKDAVTLCSRGDGACIGNGINHNKFLLFSSLDDGSKSVVVQSSSNFTGGMLGEHNNAVIVKNDPALFQGYVSYFGDLRHQQENLSYYRTIQGARARTYVYPRAQGDTVVSVLDNVRCQKGQSKIRVAMAFFTEARGEIADRLVQLQGKGCDVGVAMREANAGPVDASIIDRLRKGGVDVGLYPKASGNQIHSKYLLIDSLYDDGNGAAKRKLVFTGSHNYTGPALRANDETMMRVDDAGVFLAFSNNWKTIRVGCPQSSPSPSPKGGGVPITPGTCTHDVCTAGDKLGQQCDACTMAVCAKDSYCCDTYWGLSCFADVEALCGKKCP